jgi:hypothetical protein
MGDLFRTYDYACLCYRQIESRAMPDEYDIEFKAKVGAWALDENCGIAGASDKFNVFKNLVYEWAKLLALSLVDALVDDDTPLDKQENIDADTRAAPIRLSSEYGRLTKGSQSGAAKNFSYASNSGSQPSNV